MADFLNVIAYHAYSLGNSAQYLSYLHQVLDLGWYMSSLQASSVSDNTSSLSSTGSLVSMSLPQPLQTLRRERLGPLLKPFEVRSCRVYLQGHLQLPPPHWFHLADTYHTSTILSVYLPAAQTPPTIQSNIPQSFPPNLLHAPTSSPGHTSNPSFPRYRGLW